MVRYTPINELDDSSEDAVRMRPRTFRVVFKSKGVMQEEAHKTKDPEWKNVQWQGYSRTLKCRSKVCLGRVSATAA